MKKSASALANAVRPLVEALESRRLMDGDNYTVELLNGQLNIVGFPQYADNVTALRLHDELKLDVNGESFTYPSANVTSIAIDTNGSDPEYSIGSDRITINAALLANTTIATGSDGTDSLLILGTTGADHVVVGTREADGVTIDPTKIGLTDNTINGGVYATLSGVEKLRYDGRGNGDILRVNVATPLTLEGSQSFAELSLDNGANVSLLNGPAIIVRTKAFTNSGGSLLNVNNNIFLIDYSDNPTNSPYSGIVQSAINGLALLGGAGYGIGSTSVDLQTKPGTMLSVVDNGLISGQITQIGSFGSIPEKSVLVTYTWRGDANLDGAVNGSDYALTDSGFSGSGSGWSFGNFNYDASIDGSDYALLDTGFSSQFASTIGIYVPAPTSIRAFKLWNQSIRVSWEAPPVAVQNYTIFASINGGEYKLVRTITTGATSTDFTNVFWGEVTFKVAARSNNGWSRVRDAFDPLTLLPTPIDVTIIDGNNEPPDGWIDPGIPEPTEPVAASGLTAEALESEKWIRLEWNYESDNEEGFVIQRKVDGDEFIELTRVGRGTDSYNDKSVQRGVKYTYRIIAYNDVGYAQPSNEADATLKLEKPSALGANSPNESEINLNWADNSLHETGFLIQYRDHDAGEAYGHDITTVINARGWSITGLKPDTMYHFRIRAAGVKESDWFEKAEVKTQRSNNLRAGLFNTGVDFYGKPIASTLETPAYDNHYGGIITAKAPTAWAANTDKSKWIGPFADQTGTHGNQFPVYSINFNLTSVGIPDGGIKGSWATDNSAVMTVNGITSDPAIESGWTAYGSLSGFTIPKELLTAGANLVSIAITSDTSHGNADGYAAGMQLKWDEMPYSGPKVSIEATDTEAKEVAENAASPDTATFRIKREGGDQTQALAVYLQPSAGLATNYTDYKVKIGDDDYGILSGSVIIPADEDHIDITVKGLKDELVEPDEPMVLMLKAAPGYRLPLVMAGLMAQVKIADNNATITAAGIDFGGQGVRTDIGNQALYDFGDAKKYDWVDRNGNGHIDGGRDYSYPVSYVRSTSAATQYLKAKPTFAVSGSGFDDTADWSIIGDDLGVAGADEFVIPAINITINPDPNKPGTYIVAATDFVSSTAALGDQIWAGEWKIKWRLVKDGGGDNSTIHYGKQDSYGFGPVTTNKLYVTGAAAPEQLHTVLELACHEANNASTGQRPGTEAEDKGVVQLIWDNFSANGGPANVLRAQDGKKLYYWNRVNTANAAFTSLIRGTDGNCGGWARLLLRVLEVSGINYAKIMKIDPNNTPAAPVTGFDINPLSGQNNPTPKFDFDDHAVIMIEWGNEALILDPSYGRKYTDSTAATAALRKTSVENQWEVASIKAYELSGVAIPVLAADMPNGTVPGAVKFTAQ